MWLMTAIKKTTTPVRWSCLRMKRLDHRWPTMRRHGLTTIQLAPTQQGGNSDQAPRLLPSAVSLLRTLIDCQAAYSIILLGSESLAQRYCSVPPAGAGTGRCPHTVPKRHPFARLIATITPFPSRPGVWSRGDAWGSRRCGIRRVRSRR